ncbi:cytochrome P450 [Colletotrichum tofieldiae]|nr:cytochrome P450 [Colletotrichum tofieldiae]GKT77218.1 cytochrome P450 [Colletotrichum tofieldiae]GKT86393.1 cytochrome P450 [Colletotrichum tofieldiae]
MANATDPAAVAGAFDAQFSQHWPAATAGLVFVLFALLAQSWFTVDPLANVPVVGKGGRWARRKQFLHGKGNQLYIDGYRQVCGTRQHQLQKDTICVPPKYLPELKKAPDDVISFTKAIDEVMLLVARPYQPLKC